MKREKIDLKVSVIIPVYNVEGYLKQCIESVINQSIKEIEIILVDDGSTDKSGVICDEYALLDDRISVIHKTNEGLSCARNDGIEISKAPFIMFVDSDDWVEKNFCELPYRAAIENDVDLVLMPYRIIKQGNYCQIVVDEPKTRDGILLEEKALYYNIFIANAAWLGLYRRQLFDDIRFPEGKCYEDVGVIHRLIHRAQRLYFIDYAGYNHRIGRHGSITDAGDKYRQDYIDMHIVRIKDLVAWGYDNYAQRLAFSLLVGYGCKEKYLVEVARQIQDNDKALRWRQIMMIHVLRHSPAIFDLICCITGRRMKE